MAISEGTLAIGSRVILPNGSTNNSLSELNDVNISNASDGQILVYDGTTNKWKNQNNNSIVKVGNPITLNTVDGGDFSEAEVGFTPKQDLHGYDNPWVGGAGKNKLPLIVSDIKSANTSGTWSDNTYNYNGIDYTINTDNDGNVVGILVDGTASDVSYLVIASSITLDSNMIMSGCPTGGASNKYTFRITKSGVGYDDIGSGCSLEVGSYTIPRIIIFNGIEINNLTFYPMIRLSTASDTFEPYSNICPITGYTELNIFQSNGSTTTPDETYTQSLGGTYYGGTYDFATGKLTVENETVDLGSLTWSAYNVPGVFYTQLTSSKKGVAGTKANILCSQYETVETKISNADILAQGDGICALQNDAKYLLIKDTSKSSMTAEQFKTAMSGVQLVYELATPTETTLTPAQISALVGDNVMWTDGDKVTVKISVYVDAQDVMYDSNTSVKAELDTKLGKEDSSSVIVDEDNNDYTLQVNAYGNVAMMRLQFKQQKTYNDWAYVKSWSYAVPFSLMALKSDDTSGNIYVTANGVQARGGTYKQNSVYTQLFLIG